MTELNLETGTGASRILVGKDVGAALGFLDPARCLMVADPEVRRFHAGRLPNLPCLDISAGEAAKTVLSVMKIWETLARLEADRSWTVFAVGGGTVSDIAGFAASTYMRGITFGFAPTTLLAQCDAAVGGKNGINHAGYKNLVGTFRQPDFVVCDPAFIASLPAEDYRTGFAEVIKHAVLASESYFALLESGIEAARAREPIFLAEVIELSVRIKAQIVSMDPSEKGLRKILNLGHTIGHGLELVFGLAHGDAVSIGLAAACMLGRLLGTLPPSHESRIHQVLTAYGLPLSVAGGAQREHLVRSVLDAVRRDKKRSGTTIDFVIPEQIGKVSVQPVEISDLERIVRGVIT